MPNLRKTLVTAVGRSAMALERLVRPQHRADPAQADRILLLQFPSTLGCFVLETVISEALRKARPGRRIAVATYGLGLEVLRQSPYVDHLIAVPYPVGNLRGAAGELRRGLRAAGFVPECVLTPVFARQRAITRLAVLAGSAWRGGFAEEPWMLDRCLQFDERISVLENNLRVAELAGGASSRIEPRVFYSLAELEGARAALAPAWRSGRPVLTVVSQGKSEADWHVERMAEVLGYAAREPGYEIVYAGTEKELRAVEELRARTGVPGISLASGRRSLGELTAVLALSDLVLSIDTGPMHLARAAGVPMVVLAPCWERAFPWLPVDLPQVLIVQGEYRRHVEQDYRLDDVSVDEVKAAVDTMTRRFPPDEAVRAARAQGWLRQIS